DGDVIVGDLDADGDGLIFRKRGKLAAQTPASDSNAEDVDAAGDDEPGAEVDSTSGDDEAAEGVDGASGTNAPAPPTQTEPPPGSTGSPPVPAYGIPADARPSASAGDADQGAPEHDTLDPSDADSDDTPPPSGPVNTSGGAFETIGPGSDDA